MGSPSIAVMVAGAAKAGSTSLLHYLSQHPELRAQQGSPEMTFFRSEDQYHLGYEVAYERYWGGAEVGGLPLAKNAGLMYSPKALDRLLDHNRDVIIVVSLRDPADRAYSHFWHTRGLGKEPLTSFEEGITAEQERLSEGLEPHFYGYLTWSDYATHLSSIYDRFSAEQVIVTTVSKLASDQQDSLRRIFLAADIDAGFRVNLARRHNTASTFRSAALARLLDPRSRAIRIGRSFLPPGAGRKLKTAFSALNRRTIETPPMKPETRAMLDARFAPMKSELEAMLGSQSPW